MTSFRRFTTAATLFLLALSTAATSVHADQPGTTIIYDAPWSPGDASRDGAAEFAVLLTVAQLRQHHGRAGIVAVGNVNGLLQPATHEALTRAACMGVAIVRIVGAKQPLVVPYDFFIEAPAQPALVVEKILADCLVRFGAPPAAANPAYPTAAESAAIRRVLSRYQLAFDAARAIPSKAVLAMGPRFDHDY
jgi:hypothetical protein